jgi:medium-chain acyl-[acyl-carrier-protein] hydrolase
MTAVQSYTYTIRSYQTDTSGQIFIHQLFNLLQDAAHKHADGIGFGQRQLVEQNLFWVLSRLSVEIVKLPQVGDEVHLSTWVKSIRGAVSEREFSISIGDETIINASSLWFSLSGDNHKPIRLPSSYSGLMIINDVYALEGGSVKALADENSNQRSNSQKIIVKHSDIDMVEHVNNATYVRWIMDELFKEPQFNKQLISLDINYLGECFLGETVDVYHRVKTDTNLSHEVVNNDHGKVICRANTVWQ